MNRTLAWFASALVLCTLTACGDDETTTPPGSTSSSGGGGGGGGGDVCGDGAVAASEACDDGNAAAGDGCSEACAVEDGYTCSGEPSVCTPLAVCGDGQVAASEDCDDGNTAAGDGCDGSCAVELGWSCTGEPSVCTATCGDGILAGADECDDGNNTDGDGCSMACAVEPGYTCSGEPSVCTASCGDGVIAQGIEECDDGNTTVDDGCSPTCAVEHGFTCTGEPSACTTTCGDGLVAAGEPCDDGNLADLDGCSALCDLETGWDCLGEPSQCTAVCGDGVIVDVETCDDGNVTDLDGCSATCTVETGFECVLEPSQCATICGDGLVTGPETCDDMNVNEHDGCAACQTSFGYTCTGTPSTCTQTAVTTAIAVGEGHQCAITDGVLRCSGNNDQGEVGIGSTGEVFSIVTVPGITNPIAVTVGEDHTCVLESGGTVKCWGDNLNLQNGGTSTTDVLSPAVISGITGATAIEAGYDHNCAIVAGGTVMCWGDNDNRQLGQGTSTTDSGTPLVVTMPDNLGATQLAAGEDHTCALLTDQTVACWGDNDNRQLGLGGTSTTDNGTPTRVVGLSGVSAITAGRDGNCALVSGTVMCWGDGLNGALGNGGTSDSSTPVAVQGLPGPADLISGGQNFACAVVAGDAYCWGDNGLGELGNGTRVTDSLVASPVVAPSNLTVAAIDAGWNGACVLGTDGKRYCWGEGEDGELGFPSREAVLPEPVSIGSFVQVDGSRFDYRGGFCAVMQDTSLQCWGGNLNEWWVGDDGPHLAVPTAIGGLTGILEVGMGGAFICARTATEVLCWGDNAQRQLGQGGTTTTDLNIPTPVQALGGTPVDIEVGDTFACAELDTGSVVCWGDSSGMQVGLMGTTDSGVPTAIPGLTSPDRITLGEGHGCALTGGVVECWGEGSLGQLGNGASADSHTPVATGIVDAIDVAAGQDHTCAVRAGGTVECWGDNAPYGLLGNGTTTGSSNVPTPVLGITDAIGIRAAANVTCALLASGGLTCWGYGLDYQLGNLSNAEDNPVPQPFFGLSSIGVADLTLANSATCIIDTTGGLHCLGFRVQGQIGNDTSLWPHAAKPAAL